MSRLPKTEGAFFKKLARGNRDFFVPIVARNRFGFYRSQLELGASSNSPGWWATSAKIMAQYLRGMSRMPDPANWILKVRVSPKTIIEMMAAAIENSRTQVAAYRKKGINPHVDVTINPKIAFCRECLAEWRARVVKIRESQSGQPRPVA